ncbi:MAG: hypothetical protein QOF48_142 [Verrucomicrobiota bacterium]|jgi:hypothetical protein
MNNTLEILNFALDGRWVDSTAQTCLRSQVALMAASADSAGIDSSAVEKAELVPDPNPCRPTPGSMKGRRFEVMAHAVRCVIGGAAAKTLAFVTCLFAGAPGTAAAEPPAAREYQLKAAFLYNFTKFVEFPAQSFSDAKAPIVIGVFGKSALSAELESAVKDRHVDGRSFVIKSLDQPGEVTQVHVVFICGGEIGRFSEIQHCLKGTGVLTVGDTDTFSKHGGMINFVMEGGKLRFDINNDSAEAAGIKLSAQLLKLARTVRHTP